ncbi:MAG TPA: PAS domain S-box protein [Thermoanaerobaculia bacterium]|jgi:PAS domain S-box-containing protein
MKPWGRGSHSDGDGFFLNSPLAAFVFDRNGCILHWNPAATATFGWKESEVIGRRLPIVPQHSQEEFGRLMQHVLAGNRLTGFEAVRQRKDGTPIAVRISSAPFRSVIGEIIGVLAMIEDLSVTRSLERSIAETDRLLAALVDASPVAIIVADPELRIRIWNAAAEQMYGWTAAEVVGQPIETIATTAAGFLLSNLSAAGEPSQGPSAVVVDKRRDGTKFFTWPAAAVIDAGQSRVATMALVRDVSQQVEAERAAVQASEELRALSLRTMEVMENERVRISREIHDDLGQLLTGVMFDLAALKNAAGHDTVAAARLDHATATIQSALASVRRIAADLRPPLLDALGLNAATQMEMATFQERTGIECNLSLCDEELGIGGDAATAVYRILQEALTNAGRHADARSVDVRMRQRNGTFYLEIRDDGNGIDPARRRAGSLGLIGMRERAAGIGGELRIEPGRPRGTVVTLVVPLEKPPGAPLPPSPEASR